MYSRQLRIIRNQNNLTQQQVADILGISRSAYCGYERGRRSPDLDTIIELSKFFKLPPENFLGEVLSDLVYDDTYYEGQADTRYLSQLSREELQLIINYRLSSSDGKKDMLSNSQEIADSTRDKTE